MKSLVKFIICIILFVVIWKNFGKIVEIGNTIVEKTYTTLVKK